MYIVCKIKHGTPLVQSCHPFPMHNISALIEQFYTMQATSYLHDACLTINSANLHEVSSATLHKGYNLHLSLPTGWRLLPISTVGWGVHASLCIWEKVLWLWQSSGQACTHWNKNANIRVDPPTPGMWVTTNVYHVQNGVHFISPSLDINMKSWMVLVEAGLIVIPWANQKSIIFLYWPREWCILHIVTGLNLVSRVSIIVASH
jgi:hypothetical protein